jgi:hypothetical protein
MILLICLCHLYRYKHSQNHPIIIISLLFLTDYSRNRIIHNMLIHMKWTIQRA